MENQSAAIVIDNGSGMIKAGIAGDEAPRVSFPTMVGRPKFQGAMVGMDQKEHYIGYEAQAKRGVLSLVKPIQEGIITEFEDMEKIWHHCFYEELKVTPEEHPVLMTETPLNSDENRLRMTQIVFENFNVNSFCVVQQAVLSLLFSGRAHGVVLDIGQDTCHSVPIFEGYSMPHAIQKSPVAGDLLTQYLNSLLHQEGLMTNDWYTANTIKEQQCYLSQDYSQELLSPLSSIEQSYTLPDGETIQIGQPRFQCAEALFQPSLVYKEASGIHEMVYNSIQKCDVDIRKELFNNIILSGGSSMFPGISDRLGKEIRQLHQEGKNREAKVNVSSPKCSNERLYSVWIGGSVLSTLTNFSHMWITKNEYDEVGPNIVLNKQLQL